MSMSRERNSGQNQNINIANNSPENVVKLDDTNRSKLHEKRNEGKIELGGMHGTSRSRIVLSSNMLSKSMEVFCHNEERTWAQGFRE